MLFANKIPFNEDDFDSIVQACIVGNNAAQRLLFKTYYGYAKSVALRYCSSYEEAEEVLNEAFLKLFQNLFKYDNQQSFKGWLRTIVINTAISYYRKNQKYRRDTVGLEDAPYPRFEDTIIEKITAEEILGLVQQIKPVYRSVFMLYVVDGYSHKEIAEIMQLNEATVRSHFMRARARLQHLTKQYYPDLFPKDWGVSSYKHNEN